AVEFGAHGVHGSLVGRHFVTAPTQTRSSNGSALSHAGQFKREDTIETRLWAFRHGFILMFAIVSPNNEIQGAAHCVSCVKVTAYRQAPARLQRSTESIECLTRQIIEIYDTNAMPLLGLFLACEGDQLAIPFCVTLIT